MDAASQARRLHAVLRPVRAAGRWAAAGGRAAVRRQCAEASRRQGSLHVQYTVTEDAHLK